MRGLGQARRPRKPHLDGADAASIQTRARLAEASRATSRDLELDHRDGASIEQGCTLGGTLANRDRGLRDDQQMTGLDRQMARDLRAWRHRQRDHQHREENGHLHASVAQNAESLGEDARAPPRPCPGWAGRSTTSPRSPPSDRISAAASEDANGRRGRGARRRLKRSPRTWRTRRGSSPLASARGDRRNPRGDREIATNQPARAQRSDRGGAAETPGGLRVWRRVRKLAEPRSRRQEIGEVCGSAAETTDAVEVARSGASEAKQGMRSPTGGCGASQHHRVGSRSSALMEEIADRIQQSQASSRCSRRSRA